MLGLWSPGAISSLGQATAELPQLPFYHASFATFPRTFLTEDEHDVFTLRLVPLE